MHTAFSEDYVTLKPNSHYMVTVDLENMPDWYFSFNSNVFIVETRSSSSSHQMYLKTTDNPVALTTGTMVTKSKEPIWIIDKADSDKYVQDMKKKNKKPLYK